MSNCLLLLKIARTDRVAAKPRHCGPSHFLVEANGFREIFDRFAPYGASGNSVDRLFPGGLNRGRGVYPKNGGSAAMVFGREGIPAN